MNINSRFVRSTHAGIGIAIVLAGAVGSGVTTILSGSAASGAPAAETVDEKPFLAENAAAMNKMMLDMDVKPTGDVDFDFVAMMAPHHQGAIDMARTVLKYGKNEQVKRLAQEIIVTQQQEIVVMRLAVGLPASPATPTTAPAPAASPLMGGMQMHEHNR
jgi:hypothetical protein